MIRHRFGSEQPESSTLEGDLNGTVLKKQKQGKRVTRTARVNGAFDVEDWDLDPGVTENCISSASYSATQCKRGRQKDDRPRWYREWRGARLQPGSLGFAGSRSAPSPTARDTA